MQTKEQPKEIRDVFQEGLEHMYQLGYRHGLEVGKLELLMRTENKKSEE